MPSSLLFFCILYCHFAFAQVKVAGNGHLVLRLTSQFCQNKQYLLRPSVSTLVVPDMALRLAIFVTQ
jgi:hypothetical protein